MPKKDYNFLRSRIQIFSAFMPGKNRNRIFMGVLGCIDVFYLQFFTNVVFRNFFIEKSFIRAIESVILISLVIILLIF